jgi:hypothetical protein
MPNCDCINKLDGAFKEKGEEGDLHISVAFTMSGWTFIPIATSRTNKRGKLVPGPTVIPTHCPLCGQPVGPEKQDT